MIWNPVLKKWGSEGEAEEDEDITDELPPTRPAAALVGDVISLFEKHRETWVIASLPDDGIDNISASPDLKNLSSSPIPSASPIASPLMPRRSPTMPAQQKAPVTSRYATAVGLEVVPSSSPTQIMPSLPTFVAPNTAKKPNIFMPKVVPSTPILNESVNLTATSSDSSASNIATLGNDRVDLVPVFSQVPTTPLQPMKKPAGLTLSKVFILLRSSILFLASKS